MKIPPHILVVISLAVIAVALPVVILDPFRPLPHVQTAASQKETVIPIVDDEPSVTKPEEDQRPVTITPPIVVPTTSTTPVPDGKPIQYVVMGFDGSRSLQMWEDTRKFARDMTASGKPLHFTYFISGVYLINYAHRTAYHPPEHPPGTSGIGFASSTADVRARVAEINAASAEGNEIASHVNGHFDGSKWTAADWNQELDAFHDAVTNIAKNNGARADDLTLQLTTSSLDIIGFRAPDLGTIPGLWKDLAAHGYAYDAGAVAKPDVVPTKNADGIWKYQLAQIELVGEHKRLLSMDYNFYVGQTNAKDVAKKGTPQWDTLHTEMVDSYMKYFNGNYQGNRAPVFIGHHFSLWNDGVYWESLKDFATTVCGLPDVRCVTYKELTADLEHRASP